MSETKTTWEPPRFWVKLTDGERTHETRDVNDAEFEQLQRSAQSVTDGNLTWEVVDEGFTLRQHATRALLDVQAEEARREEAQRIADEARDARERASELLRFRERAHAILGICAPPERVGQRQGVSIFGVASLCLSLTSSARTLVLWHPCVDCGFLMRGGPVEGFADVGRLLRDEHVRCGECIEQRECAERAAEFEQAERDAEARAFETSDAVCASETSAQPVADDSETSVALSLTQALREWVRIEVDRVLLERDERDSGY